MKNKYTLPREMQELASAISKLPPKERGIIGAHFEKVSECNRRRARILELVQEAFAQFRVDMKYLFFDLECTRRERDVALND